ncbi:MAG: hypothetical protein EBZ59_04840 [Planctomycetia bacterium]|nr:hypothetical protein [Planctomycetia bacterium]
MRRAVSIVRCSTFRRVAMAAVLASVATLLPRPAAAAPKTWVNTTTGLWFTDGNWSGGTRPVNDATTDTAIFSSTNGDQTVQINGNAQIAGITITNTASTTFTNSTTAAQNVLQVGASGITIAGTAGAVSIFGTGTTFNVWLRGDNNPWTNDSTQPFTVNGVINAAFTPSGTATLTVAGSGSTVFSGTITAVSSRLALVKNGSGTLVINSSNGTDRGTTLNAGVLIAGSTNALGTTTNALTVNNGGTLNLNGYSNTIGSLNLAAGGLITTSNATGTATLTLGGGAQTTTVSGAINDNGQGKVAVVVPATASGTFNWAGTGNYSGGTTLLNGAHTISSTSAFSTGYVRFNQVANFTFATSGTLANTWDGNWSGGASAYFDPNGNSVTLSGMIGGYYQGGSTLGLVFGPSPGTSSSGTMTLTGTVVGTPNSNFGPYNGTSNGPGLTIPAGGKLVLGNAFQFGTVSGSAWTPTITVGGVLEYASSVNATMNTSNLVVTGTAIFSGPGNFTLGATNGASMTGAVVLNGGTMTVQAGSGWQVLRPSLLTFNGGTIDATGAISGTYSYPQAWNGNFAFGGSAPLNLGSGTVTLGTTPIVNIVSSTYTVAGNIVSGVGTQGITKAGSGLLVLTGTNTYTGVTTIQSGTLQIGTGTTFGDIRSSGTLSIGTGATLAFNRNDGYGGNYANRITGSGGIRVAGAGGALTLSGTNDYTGPTTVASGTLIAGGTGALGDAAGTISVAGGVLSLGSNVFTRTGPVQLTGGTIASGTISDSTGSFDLQAGTVSAGLAGAAGLSKTGAGTVTLSGSNTYTGTTSVTAGTLAITNANALGNSAGLITVGGGVLDLGSQVVTRTGTVQLAGGTIQTGTITNNTVTYDIQAGTASAGLAGSAGLTKTGTGLATLSGSSTYLGPTTVSGGTLSVTNAFGLGSGTANLFVNGGVLSIAV